VVNTNKYAKVTYPKPEQWTDVTRIELQIYIAFVIYMGYSGSSPIDEYWYRGEKAVGHHPIMSSMSKHRFLQV
jgi:hypothetical protein